MKYFRNFLILMIFATGGQVAWADKPQFCVFPSDGKDWTLSIQGKAGLSLLVTGQGPCTFEVPYSGKAAFSMDQHDASRTVDDNHIYLISSSVSSLNVEDLGSLSKDWRKNVTLIVEDVTGMAGEFRITGTSWVKGVVAKTNSKQGGAPYIVRFVPGKYGFLWNGDMSGSDYSGKGNVDKFGDIVPAEFLAGEIYVSIWGTYGDGIMHNWLDGASEYAYPIQMSRIQVKSKD